MSTRILLRINLYGVLVTIFHVRPE
ncbi:hypothetical protein F383_39161 [Gossypium arboreum]|uniref:Uncharacterized protein n=1 Tax=Gossypium arboreum TaxID=29729 RepID=A0A0B0MFX4_GOSAR|nr:hypothetical protein F383_39161 [Gossypium arboreum]